jgi:hypothetical protein
LILIILKTGITGRIAKKISPKNLPDLSDCKSVGCLEHFFGIKAVVSVILLQLTELYGTGHTSIIPKFHDPTPPVVWHDITKESIVIVDQVV